MKKSSLFGFNLPARPDLVVLGGGHGGLILAAHAAKLGARVILVEESPPERLLRPSPFYLTMKLMGSYGHLSSALKEANQVLDQFIPEIPDLNYPTLSITRGEVKFKNLTDIVINGETFRPYKIVIAPDHEMHLPRIPGLLDSYYLTPHSLGELPNDTRDITIIGCDRFSVEAGVALAQLGVEVIILCPSSDLLPALDTDTRAAVLDFLNTKGINVMSQVRIGRLQPGEKTKVITFEAASGKSHQIKTSQVLVSSGYAPFDPARFGLDEAVLLKRREDMRKEYKRFKKEQKRQSKKKREQLDIEKIEELFIAGQKEKVSFSIAHDLHVIANVYALNPQGKFQDPQETLDEVNYLLSAHVLRIPTTPEFVPTTAALINPPVIHLGFNEAQAREKYGTPQILYGGFNILPGGIYDAGKGGFIKLITTASGHIVGVCLMVAGALELAGVFKLAMLRRMKISGLLGLSLPVPSNAQIIQNLAQQWILNESQAGKGGWILRWFKFIKALR